jgi:uncharacterized protein (TIGR00369 family)
MMVHMSTLIEKLLMHFVPNTPHMTDVGLSINSLAAGDASMSMPARADWLGDAQRGLMHPGPLTVLADSCAGLAVVSALEKTVAIATLDLRMDYLRRAVPDKPVECRATCVRMATNVAFVDAQVWQDRREEPVALARGAFMIATPKTPRNQTPPTTDNSVSWSAPLESTSAEHIYPIPYAKFLGIQTSNTPSCILYRLPFKESMVGNPRLRAIHGGVVAGFSETAALLHVIQTLGGTKQPKSIDFSIDYLRSAGPFETFASCEVIRLGARAALIQVRCWQREPNYPVTLSRVHLLLG